jgi:carbonic anhydrase
MNATTGHKDGLGRPSRRQLLRWTFATLAGAGTVGATRARSRANTKAEPSRDPDEILRGLVAGNQRFASGEAAGPRRRPEDFLSLAEGQTPLAVIVGCADSRVPPEVVFDQGVGDLFVVREAGNIISGAGVVVKGSIEYAVAELGVPVIVVLGHSSCGAIKAALQHIEKNDVLPGAIGELVKVLRPVAVSVKGKPGNPLDNAIRANVGVGVQRLKTLQPILAPAVAQKRLRIVGGVYDLKTGRVSIVA